MLPFALAALFVGDWCRSAPVGEDLPPPAEEGRLASKTSSERPLPSAPPAERGTGLLGTPPAPGFEPIPPEPVLVDFPLDEPGVALAAAKSRLSVHASTQVITILTAEQLRDRGVRTLSGALRLVPGWDGDRVDFYGWTEDALARGQARTMLVLVDGVGTLEPTRNLPLLDHRLPIEAVRRIEVTSGPGSVLWGSHALLGVVHVITYDAESHALGRVPSFAARAGSDGLGEVSLGRGWRFSDAVSLFVSATYRTARPPSLTLDAPRITGPTPSPEPDGPSQLAQAQVVTASGRSHVASSTGQLKIGPLSLGWMASLSREAMAIGPGGGALNGTYFPSSEVQGAAGPRAWPDTLETRLHDSVTLLWLRYGATLLPALDLTTQLSWSWWELDLLPLGVFPTSAYAPVGLRTDVSSDGAHRLGGNLDLTARLPGGHRLVTGGEVQADMGSAVRIRSYWPGGALAIPTPGPGTVAGTTGRRCPDGYDHRPDLDPARPCSTLQTQLPERSRATGGLYVHDDWRVTDAFGLSAGVRGHFDDRDSAVLFSAGLVYQPLPELALRLGYAEGIRPPDREATDGVAGLVSGIALDADSTLPSARSRAVEADISGEWISNALLRRASWRVSGAFTLLDDALTRRAGRYDTSDRHVGSVELAASLELRGGASAFAAYTFLRAHDQTLGRMRNVPEHLAALGGRWSGWRGLFGVSSTLTMRGAVEDLNRANTLDDGLSNAVGDEVLATELEVTELPVAWLWRLGVESRGLFGALDLAFWVDDLLDSRPADPDLDFDDRIFARPQPRSGRSFWAEARVSW